MTERAPPFGEPQPPAPREAAAGGTVILSSAALRSRSQLIGDWVHSLRVVEGASIGRRVRVGPEPVSIGRRAGLGLQLADAEVSSLHCRVHAEPGRPALEVVDEGSTNGTFVDGRRVDGRGTLRDGGLLQIGRNVLHHEFRPRAEMDDAERMDRELERARHYVESLLPPPLTEGPVRTEWFFRPSAMLGGDAFGVLALPGQRLAGYLIDVCGHGAGVAMHTVTVMNVLRQQALPDTDFAVPSQVVSRLNTMFAMERHDGFYFTMWYGVYDPATRELAYASAGHHPAMLRAPALAPQPATLEPLATRNPPVGTAPAEHPFVAGRQHVAPGSRLYIFSDGLFELTDRDGRQWGLSDLMPFLRGCDPAAGEPERLYRAVRAAAGDVPLEDDCSIITVTFP